jgi:hypothetical protein
VSCLKLPVIPPLAFPVGITVALPVLPPLPDISFALCCHINIPLSILFGGLSLPGIAITANLLAPINAVLLQVDAVLDSIQINCPLE